MIVVVCLNPALDITHQVPAVDWAGVNRPARVYSRPGGKGTNVARTLRSFGVDLVLTGLAGGAAGRMKMGHHVAGDSSPVSRVGLTIQKAMGVSLDSWGKGSMEIRQPYTELLA